MYGKPEILAVVLLREDLSLLTLEYEAPGFSETYVHTYMHSARDAMPFRTCLCIIAARNDTVVQYSCGVSRIEMYTKYENMSKKFPEILI